MNAIRAEGASKIRGAIVFAIFLFIATCFFGRESRSDQRGVRTVNFSGAEWMVKSGYGGPGPNVWSDSEESAAREIAIYFSEDEMCGYQSDLSHWTSLNDEQ